MALPQRKRFARIEAYFLVMIFWPLFVIAGWTDPGQTVDAHNQKRRIHGVPDLVWDDDRARGVESWVYQCDFQDSAGPHLENLYASSEGPVPSIYSVVGSWYKEINIYDFNHRGFIPGTGNFTQVIWRESQRVGCAFVTDCPRGPWKTVLACDYAPRRNISGNSQENVLPLGGRFVPLASKLPMGGKLARILQDKPTLEDIGLQPQPVEKPLEVNGVKLLLTVGQTTVRYAGDNPSELFRNGALTMCKKNGCDEGTPYQGEYGGVMTFAGNYPVQDQLYSMVDALNEPLKVLSVETKDGAFCEEAPSIDGHPGKQPIVCKTYYEIPNFMKLTLYVNNNVQGQLSYNFQQGEQGNEKACGILKTALEAVNVPISFLPEEAKGAPMVSAFLQIVTLGLDVACG